MSKGKVSKEGDVRIAPNGYHYTYTGGKFVLTHRLYAELYILKRPLYENEYVGFKDNDRTNLDLSNIEVRVRKETSVRRKLAQLRARREQLDLEIKELEDSLVSK